MQATTLLSEQKRKTAILVKTVHCLCGQWIAAMHDRRKAYGDGIVAISGSLTLQHAFFNPFHVLALDGASQTAWYCGAHVRCSGRTQAQPTKDPEFSPWLQTCRGNGLIQY